MKRNVSPLEYFRELSQIPRVSGNEKGIADYVETVAKAHGCQVYRDEMHNLIVKKAATAGYEAAAPFMIQGHLDMVGEAAPGVVHDFAADPIRLVEKDGILTADGTTLGADDGIAIALMLAVLTDETLVHPALECVFTVQEETGLYGALALDTSKLKARSMLNLDAGPEGIFVASCAGGCRVTMKGSVQREAASDPLWNLEVSGAAGGHSGSAIANGGANAIVVAASIAQAMRGQNVRLASVCAGDKDNVIPQSASLVLSFAGEPDLSLAKQMAAVYEATDPNLTITFTPAESQTVLTQESSDAVLDLMYLLPHGVNSYSATMPGLVETSSNLAVAKVTEKDVEIHLSLRSSADLRKAMLLGKVQRLAANHNMEVSTGGVYPGWSYAPQSALRDMAKDAFLAVYGYEPTIQGIHAGLECGVLKGAMPDLDIIATGPKYGGMHTPGEWMDIASIDRTYAFVKELLRRHAQK